jgi:transcriptional regulator with XRE-family HTH domain
MAIVPGAAALKQFLELKGLTQHSLAIAIGVSDPTVHDWVDGIKRPRHFRRKQIEDWSRGEVLESLWLTEVERETIEREVVPFDGVNHV